MATEGQICCYNSLCEQLGQEPEEEFESLSNKEAWKVISELIDMLEVMEGG